MKKFGAKRAGTGTVDEAASNSLRWATSAAGQMQAASGVVALNVKRIPVKYVREDNLNPRKLAIGTAEVAELALFSTTAEKKRRERIVTALVRLVQLGRAAGIYVEICGQPGAAPGTSASTDT